MQEDAKKVGKPKKRRTLPKKAEPDNITTVMVKGIPCSFSQDAFMNLIDNSGLKGKYDFFYLPRAGNNGSNLGYCFINFVTPEDAEQYNFLFNGISVCANYELE